MACLMVAIVTRPGAFLPGWAFCGDSVFVFMDASCLLPAFSFRAGVLLGVGGRDSVSSAFVLSSLVAAASYDCSAISTARRQMSSARRASPLTAATFRLANWIASGSTMFPGTLLKRVVIISIKSVCLYPGNVIRVRPRRLEILLLNVRSGRSIVFATARTMRRECRRAGQLKKLYITD